jgi:hypothetical protein
MFEKAPIGRLFVPGKVIQIRRGLCIERIVFVEVQEHIRHVRAMVDFLYPDACDRVRLGADWHDLGKKFLNHSYNRALQGVTGKKRKGFASRENQVKDFWGHLAEGEVTPKEAFRAFEWFVREDGSRELTSHVRIWPHKDNPERPDEVTRYDYQFDPPFGFHAAEVEATDLPADLADADRRYLLDLIHLHHSFQADKLVEAAAEHGEGIIHDLYRLMVCDHFGSGWAEHVAQVLEQGDVTERGSGMRFAEFELTLKSDVIQIKRDEPHVHGQIVLFHDGRTLDLDVHYFVFDFYLDGAEEAARQAQTKRGGRK